MFTPGPSIPMHLRWTRSHREGVWDGSSTVCGYICDGSRIQRRGRSNAVTSGLSIHAPDRQSPPPGIRSPSPWHSHSIPMDRECDRGCMGISSPLIPNPIAWVFTIPVHGLTIPWPGYCRSRRWIVNAVTPAFESPGHGIRGPSPGYCHSMPGVFAAEPSRVPSPSPQAAKSCRTTGDPPRAIISSCAARLRAGSTPLIASSRTSTA
jgi:hypothetical protein